MYQCQAGREGLVTFFRSGKLCYLIIMFVAIIAIQHPVDFQDVAVRILAFERSVTNSGNRFGGSYP